MTRLPLPNWQNGEDWAEAAPRRNAWPPRAAGRRGRASTGPHGKAVFQPLRCRTTFSCSRVARSPMPTHKRIDVSKIGDVTVVKFVDRKILDEAGIQELGAELFALVERDNRRSILLNFADVDFLSSAALGKLITLDRKVKSLQGRMKMSNIRPEIMEVFQITKLNKVFDIRGEEAEAISAF
jgi:anti-sigma B factor antagonist